MSFDLNAYLSRNIAAHMKESAMTDSRYAGAMPDSFFRILDEKEESEMRQWAHDNYTLTLPEGFAMFHPVVRDEWRIIESTSESYDVSLIDVCLSCYLTDHHNRDGEQLLCVAVDGSTRNGHVASELRAELQNYEFPRGFNYGAAELAIADCMSKADGRRLFDSSLERGECDESCYAYFLLSYTIGARDGGAPNLDDMTTDPAELRAWAVRHDRGRRIAAELFSDKPAGYVSATRQLARYADNKATAMECRARGDISAAADYERICGRIYDRLPPFARW